MVRIDVPTMDWSRAARNMPAISPKMMNWICRGDSFPPDSAAARARSALEFLALGDALVVRDMGFLTGKERGRAKGAQQLKVAQTAKLHPPKIYLNSPPGPRGRGAEFSGRPALGCTRG
ncbi:protein of unknown function [Agreia sp. COWG]|nr:protein of unknown function [Agreia sp. COWG]